MLDHPVSLQEEAVKHFLSMKQGRRSVSEHSIHFWIIAEETGWGERTLSGTLTNSFSEQIKDQLVTRDEPQSPE